MARKSPNLHGQFLSVTIVGLFTHIPNGYCRGMMFLVGVELTRPTWKSKINIELIPMITTILVVIITNMALGFLTGLLVNYLI